MDSTVVLIARLHVTSFLMAEIGIVQKCSHDVADCCRQAASDPGSDSHFHSSCPRSLTDRDGVEWFQGGSLSRSLELVV